MITNNNFIFTIIYITKIITITLTTITIIILKIMMIKTTFIIFHVYVEIKNKLTRYTLIKFP